MPFRRSPLAANAALAVAYAAIGLATLALGETGGVELRRIIWASSGIAVTVGLLAPFPVWLGAGIGGALATQLSGSGPVMVLATGVANGVEVAITVYALRRLRFSPALDTVRDILLLLGVGSGAAAAVGAVLSVGALHLSGGVPEGAALRIFLMWWITHAMGILTITPVGLTLARGSRLLVRRAMESAGVLVAAFATSWISFTAPGESPIADLLFLPLPFLLWASIRLGTSGAALAGLVVGASAVAGTVRHTGPFTAGTMNQDLVLTWLYTNTVALSTLICAALVAGIDRAREAHRSGEARLRAVLDGTTDGIVVADAGGVITHVNQPVLSMWPPGALLPVLGANVAPILQGLANFSSTPDAMHLLSAVPAGSGRVGTIPLVGGRTWEVHVEPLPWNEHHRGSLWLFRDVTSRLRAEEERQQLQSQLLHGQKLESLGVMAGGIAHDFNNLLMAMRATAELIGDTDGLPPEVKEDSEAILRTADQAAGLCRQLLTYAGRGQIEVRTVDLGAAVREIRDLLRVSVSKQVGLEVDLPTDPLWIAADVAQVRQVVLNLVANASDAVEATGRGGTVRVRAGTASLGPDWLSRAVIGQDLYSGEFCVVEVEDDGVGIDADHAGRIFDPFFSSKGTGRGLGLSSVLGVVRRHRGALAMESRPGRGSRFTVAFRAVDGPPMRATPPGGTAVEEGLAGRTVLVVDDDDDVRRAVVRLLERMGMQVREASDGEAALAELADGAAAPVDVVLLDLTMPRKGGPQTLAEMRARGLTVPVVVASGYSEESLPPEAGAVDFVQKPYRGDALREAIVRALARSVRSAERVTPRNAARS